MLLISCCWGMAGSVNLQDREEYGREVVKMFINNNVYSHGELDYVLSKFFYNFHF